MVGILGEVPVEDLSRTFIRFSRCVLSELWFLLIGQHQGRGSAAIAAGPEAAVA